MKSGKEQMEIFHGIHTQEQPKMPSTPAYGKNPENPGPDWQRQELPSEPGLVVSIHDVCPGTREATETMLADLRSVGVNKTSLLVIPNRHHTDPAFEGSPESIEFCKWLLECAMEGHELVLHGYWHQRVATQELRGFRRLIARHYTAGEGEFFDLSRAQAIGSLAQGLREMEEALGVSPAGFIAPAWLLGSGARQALREFPFLYTTLLHGVWDLKADTFYPSQSLCYSVRAPWRRACSLAWNSALLAWLDDAPLVRLGLHPPDWNHGSIRSHALFCAERALVDRPAMTYDSWVHRQSRRNLSES
jgi:uncharacterized protein